MGTGAVTGCRTYPARFRMDPGGFGEEPDIGLYGFDSRIPVGIYGGDCQIDFTEVVRNLKMAERLGRGTKRNDPF